MSRSVPLPPGVQDPRQLQEAPYYYSTYGPDANCTIAICGAELSLYQYQPKLSAQIAFIVFFGIALVIHLAMGIYYKSRSFVTAVVIGCICELIGYGGRIMLHQNPFSFNGFLIQIILITFAPVFFTAGIYFTLAATVRYLGEKYARFPAKFYYWIFIPCDVLSLVLQAIGGASSSTSSGTNKWAVNVSLAGLSFQVFTLCVFIVLSVEFGVRYWRATDAEVDKTKLPRKFKVFVTFLTLATVFILVRCIYRIDELSQGYTGPLISDEGLFIALEGVMVLIAVYFLMLGHPGPILPGRRTGDITAEKV